MKKVYQTIIDPKTGDCMQAVIASLLELELNQVPKFIEIDNWFGAIYSFLKQNGYHTYNFIHNKNYTRLATPTDECFKKSNWHRPSIITKKALYRYSGVNGYFFASVLSPKFFSLTNNATHAVVIDKDYNIVHDPNPEYSEILEYPLKSLLGYNGIIDVIKISKV
jgi:hypothetical protein